MKKLFLFVTIAVFSNSLGLNSVTPTRILWDVPLYTQTTDYSCGAAALVSVLGYYGIEVEETDVMKAVGTNPSWGTDHKKMRDYLIENGITAVVKTNLSLQELAKSVNAGHPVIVELQAWSEDPIVNYENEWDDGHYMTVIGLDENNVYFVDPSLFGSRGVIPIPQFMKRWHDIPSAGKKWYRTGILMKGIPKPPPVLKVVP